MLYEILLTIFFFFIFIFLSFLTFYSVGFILTKKSPDNLEEQEILSLSFCFGIVLFVLTGIAFGFLHLRFLVLPLVIVFSLYSIFKFKKLLFSPWKIFWEDKFLFILIVLGILVQGFINFPSGFLFKDGLYFWAAHGHDGLWHIALMEEIKNSFPPQNPVFAGHPLYNYHYLGDILMGEFRRIFPFFSSLDLYFRFFPVVYSFLINMSAYAFLKRWTNNKKAGYFAIFFSYFVGSFGYIVTFIKNGNFFGGETIFWAAQGNTIIGNTPHAIAYSLVTIFFLAFLFYVRNRNLYWCLCCFLIGCILGGFKVSAGFVLLAGLAATTFFDLVVSRRITIFYLWISLAISNFITIKSMTNGVSSFLIFQPWWFIRTMVVAPDRLGWIDLELRRQHYLANGSWHAIIRVIQLEVTAFFIFLFGNLGTRLLGFGAILGQLFFVKKIIKSPLNILILATMIVAFLVPLFFVQKGIAYNNIQFFQYFLLIFGFYAALASAKIWEFLSRRTLKLFFLIALTLISIPTVVGNFNEFYGPRTNPLAKITNGELGALSFLRENSNPSDIILTKPFNKYSYNLYKKQPWPIYAWYNTCYVNIFSGRHTYLSDEEMIQTLSYDSTGALEKAKTFFAIEGEKTDFGGNKRFLKDENISYIYLAKGELDREFDPTKNGLSTFFENEDAIIYKVNKG
jgi:hypothetical protein